MKDRPLTAKDVLSSCMEIEKTRINRRFFLPRQIIFRLNPNILGQLEAIRAKNANLTINPDFIVSLRCYALLNSGLPEILKIEDRHYAYAPQTEFLPSSCLIFTTNYLEARETKVIRSEIDLTGQINQQIQQDLWHDPKLLPRIISVHHWLIVQILERLPGKKSDRQARHRLRRVIASLWLIISLSLSICLGFSLPIHIALKIFIAIVSFYFLIAYFNRVLKQQLRLWILSYLIYSFARNNLKRQQLAWTALAAFD